MVGWEGRGWQVGDEIGSTDGAKVEVGGGLADGLVGLGVLGEVMRVPLGRRMPAFRG